MLIYIVLFILIVLCLNKINNKKMNFYDYFILIILICICGFRYNVGSDYQSYILMYNNISFYPRTEIFVKIIINILNYLNFNYSIFFFFMSFLTILIFYLGIKRISNYPSHSLLLFVTLGYYSMCFNGVRQMLAASICFYSTSYLIENKTKKFIISVILASLFHQTALIMLPIFLFYDKKISKITYFLIFIFFSLSIFIYQPLLEFIIKIIPQYSVYINRNNLTFWSPGIGTFVIGIIHLILILVIFSNRSELENINFNNRIYINLFFLSSIFFFLSFVNALMVRMAYYFSIYLILLLPALLEILFGKKNNRNYILILGLYFVYFLTHLIFFNQMIPYTTIFN